MCENYLVIKASEATINTLMADEFCMRRFFPPPAELDGEELSAWIHKNYSTKWICNWNRDALPVPERSANDTLIVDFYSAWFFPFEFYKKLVGRFPDIRLNYEYHCWESGFIGHGEMATGSLSDPIHCRYDTLAELEAFMVGHSWHVDTCNPQLEYEAHPERFHAKN